MKLIKGEAAHWANKEKLFNQRFVWAEDYYAVSLSKTAVGNVRNYIRNQEEHHKKKNFYSGVRGIYERAWLFVGLKPVC